MRGDDEEGNALQAKGLGGRFVLLATHQVRKGGTRMTTRRVRDLVFCVVLATVTAFGQANGKLQIHFMNVGQGDGAVLISPKGEVVLFDNGRRGACDRPVSYLDQLGVQKIDYHIASHYHSDHIGCTTDVLDAFELKKAAYDRGHQSTTVTYDKYVIAVGSKRKTATVGGTLTLDKNEPHPVTITFIAANADVGDGQVVSTSNENDLSLVATVSQGTFDVVIGGDLSGVDTGNYEDIEGPLAAKVGAFEVYKVHHHGSRYSSNDEWLAKINAQVGIISTGNGNTHGHPTQLCL